MSMDWIYHHRNWHQDAGTRRSESTVSNTVAENEWILSAFLPQKNEASAERTEKLFHRHHRVASESHR
jgi:hypothetical protein